MYANLTEFYSVNKKNYIFIAYNHQALNQRYKAHTCFYEIYGISKI